MRTLLKTKKKIFSAAELIKLVGNRMTIARLVKGDDLFSLGAGFYSTPAIDPYVAMVHVVAKYYPKAVISGISALHIHNLSDERTDTISVDLPKGTQLRNKMLLTRRVVARRLVGIQTLDFYGAKIRIYDPERSLCDAYRIDRGALFYKALKRYLKSGAKNYEAIAKYDKILNTKVLRSIQQELADS